MAKKNGARTKTLRFETEATMSADEVAGYLEDLAQSLRAGSVEVGEGPEGVRVAIESDVELEVEARRGKRKARIELTLAFRAAEIESHRPSADGTAPAAADTIPDEMSF
jgi:amphi-Trp domain-containing protein